MSDITGFVMEVAVVEKLLRFFFSIRNMIISIDIGVSMMRIECIVVDINVLFEYLIK